MSYSEAWAALAARIKGLQSAGQLYAGFQSSQQQDSYGTGDFLRQQCQDVIRALQGFRVDFADALPAEAVTRLDEFCRTRSALAAESAEAGQGGGRAALVALAAFEAEITFILAGRQEHMRARSELALMHLQQCLSVDDDLAAKWKKAYDKSEPACERLGAIHLLSHGIFAFKVDANGARTDLVHNEPPDRTIVTRGVEGLVLTEWKIAEDERTATQKFDEARAQARLYSQGALAGIELRGYRYLIVVSLRQLVVPQDEIAGNVVYRHVNIAVQPEVPSKAAPKIARRSKHDRLLKGPARER